MGVSGRILVAPLLFRKKNIKLSSTSADFAETKQTKTMGIAKFWKKIEETLL